MVYYLSELNYDINNYLSLLTRKKAKIKCRWVGVGGSGLVNVFRDLLPEVCT